MKTNDVSYHGRACGKLILTGEHAVVYGEPCIATPIDIGIQVQMKPLEPQSDTKIHLQYKNNPPLLIDERLKEAVFHVMPRQGWMIDFHSELPFSAGMGSSAACSVALLRAWNQKKQIEASLISKKHLYNKAHEMECFFHGTPSGIDHSVIIEETALWFQKSKDQSPPLKKFISLPTLHIIIINSHVIGNTKEQVQKVRRNLDRNKNTIFEIGNCTQHIHVQLQVLKKESSIENQRQLGLLFLENHRLLQQIQVSHPILDRIVDTCMDLGCLGAKMAGSGGGGIAFAYVSNTREQERISKLLIQMGYDALPLTLNSH